MANFSGKGSMGKRDLIAVWRESQQTTLEGTVDGQVTGAYLDIQLDQSGLTDTDIAEGKAQTNPHLENRLVEYTDRDTGETKKAMDHTVWYSARQMAAMSGGQVPQQGADGRYVMAFNADIINRQYTDKETGQSRTRLLVACPKDLDKVKPEDRARAESFNEKHQIVSKDYSTFDVSELLNKQDASMKGARMQRDEKAAVAELEQQAESQVEAEDEGFAEFD